MALWIPQKQGASPSWIDSTTTVSIRQAPSGNAVNCTMMMDGAEYIVIGVYAKAKGGFFGENGQDNAVTIPLRTAGNRYPQVDRFMITAKAKARQTPGSFTASAVCVFFGVWPVVKAAQLDPVEACVRVVLPERSIGLGSPVR